MKIFSASIFFLVVMGFITCTSTKDTTTRDINRLLYPVPSTFSSVDSAQLLENWKIGLRFYKSNCAGCHGIFGKGKENMPNFSKEQVDDYKGAFLAGDKLNHAIMSKMTEVELNNVFLFLSSIKR